MTVKTANKKRKEVPENHTQLQLYFHNDLYADIEQAVTDENKRLGLVGKHDKLYKYNVIPLLVKQGIAFRNHEIYLPEEKRRELLKDEKFSKLYAKAQLAMEDIKSYLQNAEAL